MSEQVAPQLEVAAPQPEVADVQTETQEAQTEVAQGQNQPQPNDNKPAPPATKQEVIERLRQYLQEGEAADRRATDQLRSIFYRLRNDEVAAAKAEFVAAGCAEDEFKAEEDAL